MLALLTRVLSSVGSVVTIYAFMHSSGVQLEPWQLSLLYLLFIFLAGIILADIISFIRNRPHTYRPNSKRITKYLKRWLESGGRAAIFTRDMSWGTDPSVKPVLIGKAEKRELLICLPEENPFVTELRKHGAEIHIYPSLRYAPRSRFTIIDQGKDDARVAIGVVEGRRHVIREFRNGVHPFVAVANDLVEIVRRISHL